MRYFIITTLLFFLYSLQALAQERIIKYKSEISINKDASLDVVETITVKAEGDKIVHGIYRIFPVRYEDHYGNDYRVDFEIVEIKKNGEKEPFNSEQEEWDIITYIGDENTYLSGGVYEYTIHFRTNRQIGYFEDFDELYWNVTGNEWNFPIDTIESIIHLPSGASIIDYAGYSGYFGESGEDFDINRQNQQIRFKSNRPFSVGEGLTVAVSWEKGMVVMPTAEEEMHNLVWDNLPAVIGALSVAITFLYWLIAWIKVGRDPKKRSFDMQSKPPEGFYPSDARYVYNMEYDNKCLTADLVQMATEGHLKIENNGKNNFEIGKTALAPDDKIGKNVWEKLFPNKSDEKVHLGITFNSNMGELGKSHKKMLEEKIKGIYFNLNTGKLVLGHIIAFASIILMFSFGPYELYVLMGIFTTVWLILASVMLSISYKRFKEYFRSKKPLDGVWILVIISTLLLFLAYCILIFVINVGSVVILVILGHLVMNVIFTDLIKAYTVEGRDVIDHLEGFRSFMEKAQEEKFKNNGNQEQILKLFEAYLPYAIALDVETAWSNNFTHWLTTTTQESYEPRWYFDRHRKQHDDFNIAGFTTSIGSGLSSSVNRTSTPSSSSSGSSGSGSSGGGGGGGGGGGW